MCLMRLDKDIYIVIILVYMCPIAGHRASYRTKELGT